MNTLEKILDHKIVAIIRGANPGHVINIAKALYNGGIRVLEITMNSADPLKVIEQNTWPSVWKKTRQLKQVYASACG